MKSSLIFLLVVCSPFRSYQTVPPGIPADSRSQNVAIFAPAGCQDSAGTVYRVGDEMPPPDPCTSCHCSRPSIVRCSVKNCLPPPPGVRACRKEGHCCPLPDYCEGETWVQFVVTWDLDLVGGLRALAELGLLVDSADRSRIAR